MLAGLFCLTARAQDAATEAARKADAPRVRHTRTFEDYRRFVSDVKILEDDEPEN